MDYLSFEKPIEELENQLTKALELADETGVDMAKTITDIQQKLDDAKKEIYSNLSAWERVQLSRHPQRPYTMAYINALTQGDFIEMHGDRGVKDDKAMVGGWGTIDGKSYMFIGQQKGVNTKMRQYRNFGMANPEGYRKALRLMKQAEKFAETDPMIGWGWKQSSGDFLTAMQSKTVHFNRFTDGLLLLHVSI
jgi:acetyl-CoA carboxylase carboxyl transferase subunit alpha